MPTPQQVTTIRNQDLVLQVASDFDPKRLRLHLYEAFIDALCEDREYQKDAIRTVCRFLGGGQYSSTADLAARNYAANPALAELYGSVHTFKDQLPFGEQLACTVDLATATGKSWVMYGVARILLAEGVVDRVLLLCPSLTIEASLREKFGRFSKSRQLNDLLPQDAVFATPDIKDANNTTGAGDICIENIDATYQHVRSSVRDSFRGQGSNTLVMNDECHHIYTAPTGATAGVRKWKQFLDDPEFGFGRIVGFSGTCYRGNDYFTDVVSRYSLAQAMEDGRTKLVYYVSQDESSSEAERFQKYLQVHEENQKRYPTTKPISIVVTSNINEAVRLWQSFTAFLRDRFSLDSRQAEARALLVTSKHPEGVARLPFVDRRNDPTEWIISVSMLTEGWDVHDIFQIVPHEKRAFNSKLLIAQVLGRGLRVPVGLSRPVVRVFNHSSWSSEIQNLVDEVLEQERRLRSYPVEGGARTNLHFSVHQLDYKTRTVVTELTPNGSASVNLFKRGYLNFEWQPPELKRRTVFADVLRGREHVMETQVQFPSRTVEEVVGILRARLKSIDSHGQTSYAREYPPTKLQEVIEASLDRIGETRGMVSEQNLQHALRALGNTQRKAARMARIELIPDQLRLVSTRDIRTRSVAQGAFWKEATVFYDSESAALSDDSDRNLLLEITAPTSKFLRQAAIEVRNKFWFKSPVNVVLTTHAPERTFVGELFKPDMSDALGSWMKSADVGFYEIGYSWRKGDHTKQGTFNPDLFLNLANSRDTLVIELKSDDDVNDENVAKYRYAKDHFDRINAMQSDRVYHMLFLSPASYDAFFQAMRDEQAGSFVSALQAMLMDAD